MHLCENWNERLFYLQFLQWLKLMVACLPQVQTTAHCFFSPHHCFKYWHVASEMSFWYVLDLDPPSHHCEQSGWLLSGLSCTIKWGGFTLYSGFRKELIFHCFSFPHCLTPIFWHITESNTSLQYSIVKKYNENTIVNTAALKMR